MKQPHIVSVKNLASGLLITFDDGRVALYSADSPKDAVPTAFVLSEAKAAASRRILQWPEEG
jgi:hypothetical protein